MFQVTEEAGDTSLLTAAELRTAIGLTAADGSQDTKLNEIGPRAFAAITRACRVAADGIKVPTLRAETCVDTYRFKSMQTSLVLTRRPIASITSVVENDVTLEATDFEREDAAGILKRLSGDAFTRWPCGKLVVTYVAGWATVPAELKDIAARLVNTYYLSGGDDPMVKSIDVPGVYSEQRWVDKEADAGMPDDIMAALERGGFVNYWIG